MTFGPVLPVLLAVSLARKSQEDLPDPWQATEQDLRRGNYLGVLEHLQAREERYLGSRWKRYYCEFLGTIHSYVGSYREALAWFDRLGKRRPHPPWEEGFQSSLARCRPVDALRAIEEIAGSHPVLFLNEAHHVPLHRAFSLQVLGVLREKGFRTLAAETLAERDEGLNERGYPLRGRSGWYTDEPVYGDLVRTALRLGYRVVAYEHAPDSGPEDEAPSRRNRRERGQARNLYSRILAGDPSARILVHAGYGHIDEKGTDGWIPMARAFREISGVDPFTIDQVEMTEHSTPEQESSHYRYAIQEGLVRGPTLFRKEDGRYWVQEEFRGRYDAQVFHPRTRYEHGRPHWLRLGGARKPYPLVEEQLGGEGGTAAASRPCLIQAFLEGEDPAAVPIDQVAIFDAGDLPALMLPAGRIRVRVLDRSGEVRSEFPVTME